MTYTYDEQCYSDLHKEAYGFRPRGATYEAWDAMTPDEKQAEWDRLCAYAEAEVRREWQLQLDNQKDLERRIAEALELGAADRETAIRWLVEAEDAYYGEDADGNKVLDAGYACFCFGINYVLGKDYFGGEDRGLYCY